MERIDVRDSCAWCGQLNSWRLFYCATCGHQAHVPRAECNCLPCQHARNAPPELLAALEGGQSALTSLAALKKALAEAQRGHWPEP
jgi:hypothetical protein